MDRSRVCPICLNDVSLERLQISEGLLDQLNDFKERGILDSMLVSYQELFKDQEMINLLNELKKYSKNLTQIREVLKSVVKDLDAMQSDLDNKLTSINKVSTR